MSTPPDSPRSFRRCAPRALGTRRAGRAPPAAKSAAVLLVASACGPEAVSEWDPRQIEAQIPVVVAALEAGDPAEALAELDRLAAAGTAPVGSDHYRGMALADLDRPAEALAAFEAELRTHPGNGRAHGLAADALLELGRVDEALAHIEQGRLLATDFPYFLVVAGRAALQGDDDQLALSAFQTYLTADATSPLAAEAHYALSQIMSRRGDAESTAYHAARSEHIQRVHQYLNLYRSRLDEDPDDAEAALAVAMAHIDLYRDISQEMRLLEVAEGALGTVLRLAPNNDTALLNLGYIRTVQGRDEDALALYVRAAESNPGRVGPRLNAGLSSRFLGRHEDAVRWFEAGLACETEPQEKERLLYELARSQVDAGRQEAAMATYEAFLALPPQDPRDAAARLAALGG